MSLSSPVARAQGLLSGAGIQGPYEQLQDERAAVRQAALEQILRTGDPSLCPWLRERLREEPRKSDLRADLIRGLGRIPCPKARPALWHRVHHARETSVVQAAVDALGRIAHPEDLPGLERLVRTGLAPRAASRALGRFGARGAQTLARIVRAALPASGIALRVLTEVAPARARALIQMPAVRHSLRPADLLEAIAQLRDPRLSRFAAPFLFHAAPEIQSRAFRALERAGTQLDAPALLAALAPPAGRHGALAALCRAALRPAPPTGLPHHRRPQSDSLARSVSPLLSLVRTARRELRPLAVQALGRLGGPEAVAALTWMAEGGPLPLRAHALRALQHTRSPVAARALGRLVRQGTALSPLAVQSLGSLLRVPAKAQDRPHPLAPPIEAARLEAISLLRRVLRGRDTPLRALAARALGRMRALAAQDDLIRLLRAPGGGSAAGRDGANAPAQVALRAAAAEGLASFRDVSVAQALARALRTDPSPCVRAAAARALAGVREPYAWPALRHAVREDSPFVALNALYAIGHLGLRSAGGLVARFLDDANPHLRANAALALGRIRYRAARARLERRARTDAQPWVRRAAALGLAWALGRRAAPALHRLLRREVHPDVLSLLFALRSAADRPTGPIPPATADWVDFRLEDDRGRPRGGVPYRLRLETGDFLTGCTDSQGFGGAERIPTGRAALTVLRPQILGPRSPR